MSKSEVCLHHWTSAKHDCWHAITFTASSFQHRHSAKSTCTRRKKTLIYCPVHHHCGLYLPWNFEKQMVPCKTVMQLARKLRTDSPGTGKLNQICTACNGHKICVHSNRAIYIVHEVGFFRLLTSRRVTARHVTARHVSFFFFFFFFFYIASMYIQIKSLKYWNDIRFCPDFPHHCNRHINLSCRENTRWSRENIDDGCTLAHECKVSKVYYI